MISVLYLLQDGRTEATVRVEEALDGRVVVGRRLWESSAVETVLLPRGQEILRLAAQFGWLVRAVADQQWRRVVGQVANRAIVPDLLPRQLELRLEPRVRKRFEVE